jgi:capsular polysaccharide transport system permease protein
MNTNTTRILFVALFIVPLILFSLYVVFYASDMYESRSQLIVTEERSSSQTVDLTFLGLPSQSNDRDALILENFVLSRDMVTGLDKKFNFRQHYGQERVDWWNRFDMTGSEESLVKYMQKHIVIEYDADAKILTLTVRAFDREYAKMVLEEIIAQSQAFMDRINEQVAEYQTAFFEKQLNRTEQRLRDANRELVDFQRKNRLLTTQTEGDLIIQNVSALEKALIDRQTQLTTLGQTLSRNAPQLANLRNEIETISAQIVSERSRLSGDSASLTELDAKSRDIQLNLEFVTNIYKSNLAQLEQMKFEAAQRQKFLLVVTAPSLADESGFPDRPYAIITAAIILAIIYFVVSLLIAVLRERS